MSHLLLPQEKEKSSFRSILLEQIVSLGFCGHLVPPLRAMQVQFLEPVAEPEVPPSLAGTALQFPAGLGKDAAIAVGSQGAWGAPALPWKGKRVHEKREKSCSLGHLCT